MTPDPQYPNLAPNSRPAIDEVVSLRRDVELHVAVEYARRAGAKHLSTWDGLFVPSLEPAKPTRKQRVRRRVLNGAGQEVSK